LGSLFAAISGLQASSRWLDVISNNVSNSNTVAFKRGRANFTDIFSQGLVSASAADASFNLGGINPSQLGLGVRLASIQNMQDQGSIQTTGNALDIALNGNGFFTLKQGSDTVYTRAGNFELDGSGFLTNQTGGLVQGWSRTVDVSGAVPTVTGVSASLDTGGLAGNIQIPGNLVLAPMATSDQSDPSIKNQGVVLSGNFDDKTPLNTTALPLQSPGIAPTDANLKKFTPDLTTTFTVHDSLGTEHQITLLWQQTSDTASNQQATWQYFAFDTSGGKDPLGSGTFDAAGNPIASNYLGGTNDLTPDVTFNGDGSLQSNGTGVLDRSGNIPPAATNLYPGPATNPTLTIPNATVYANAPFNYTPAQIAALNNGAVTPFTFSMNFGTPNVDPNPNPPVGSTTAVPITFGKRDGLTGDYGSGSHDMAGNYMPNSTVGVAFLDGYAEGFLTDLSVKTDGSIQASFSNDQNITMAKLELSKFNNADGLEKVGDVNLAETANSGSPQTGVAGTDGFGTTLGRSLEASNVDMGVELTNMILAQRMFDTNAKLVTATDETLQTTNDMVR
jgi:flagellar hook protein FlgE